MPIFTVPDSYLPSPEGFANSTILVTGAGDGLGKSLAIKLASLGANVILLGRTVAKLESVYDEIEKSRAPQAAIYPLDLSGASVENYQEMARSIEGEFGKLDGLVHCAAALGPMTPLAHYPVSDWQKTLHTNLTGPVFLTQSCLSLLTQSESSSIIFTLDSKTRAYWGAYGIAKSAIESSMRIFADELDTTTNQSGKRIVSVNAVEPGPMRTQIRRLAFPGENAQRVPKPVNFADYYLYLLDKKIDQPNGCTIETHG